MQGKLLMTFFTTTKFGSGYVGIFGTTEIQNLIFKQAVFTQSARHMLLRNSHNLTFEIIYGDSNGNWLDMVNVNIPVDYMMVQVFLPQTEGWCINSKSLFGGKYTYRCNSVQITINTKM